MQWNPSNKIPSTATINKIDSEQLSHYDSGLEKENSAQDLVFKHESDLSLYGSSSPNRLEDHDFNTQDSGYEGGKFYQFAQTLGVTPQNCWSGKRTFGSLDSFEEEFMDLQHVDENAQLPTDFNTLICGELVHEELTPNSLRFRPTKRPKSEFTLENEASIKFALSSSEPDLIGDFSKSYCLPLTSGRHQDLKCITPNTLANVIKGIYNLDSYKIIDCRFPYEFNGGHVNGAINLYTKDQILDLLNEGGGVVSDGLRNVLIFHCEFSSERGPKLCRYLRNLDRIHNKDAYPKLNYPELYILEGGYKKFYEEFQDLCLPMAYTPMLHPEYLKDLHYFKNKSNKSSSESRLNPNNNRGKCLLSKRLGFL